MNIAIIGTRGIPNRYGGFEQFAEHLSKELVTRGHQITVYNSSLHPFKEKVWNGVEIVHCFDPENRLGTVGQFIYDFNCIADTRNKNFDIILQLGYTSSTVWWWLLPRGKSKIITNMDGLEWKRSKYSKYVQKFLLYAEKLGVKHSHTLIADSRGIQKYLKEKYNATSEYIPYGTYCFENPDSSTLEKYALSPYGYNMLIARLEPENNIEMILDAAAEDDRQFPFIVLGNTDTRFGKYIQDKFKNHTHIKFLNSLYNADELNNLCYFSKLYFHGHSVGGTNPSLIEAMAAGALVCAHNNIFNKAVLEEDGFYFSCKEDITDLMNSISKQKEAAKIQRNLYKTQHIFSWKRIADQYEACFANALECSNTKKVSLAL